MAGAGQVELVVEVVGDAGLDAQQHAVGQGGVGFGQELVEQGFAVGAQGVDALQNGAAQIGAVEHVDACAVHQAVDVLARQILPVREILEVGRRHQPATQAHRLAVDIALADAGAQTQPALDRLHIFAGRHRIDRDDDGLLGVLDGRVAAHHAGDHNLGRVAIKGPIRRQIVVGQIVGRPAGRQRMGGIAGKAGHEAEQRCAQQRSRRPAADRRKSGAGRPAHGQCRLPLEAVEQRRQRQQCHGNQPQPAGEIASDPPDLPGQTPGRQARKIEDRTVEKNHQGIWLRLGRLGNRDLGLGPEHGLPESPIHHSHLFGARHQPCADHQPPCFVARPVVDQVHSKTIASARFYRRVRLPLTKGTNLATARPLQTVAMPARCQAECTRVHGSSVTLLVVITAVGHGRGDRHRGSELEVGMMFTHIQRRVSKRAI